MEFFEFDSSFIADNKKPSQKEVEARQKAERKKEKKEGKCWVGVYR